MSPRFRRLPTKEHEAPTRCPVGAPGCFGIATQEHHLKNRSQGGSKGRTVRICAACHDWIGRNPVAATAQGWRIPSWQN